MASGQKDFATFRDTVWSTGLFRAGMIVLLTVGALAAPVAVLRAVTPWRLGYMLPLTALAGGIAVFDTLRLGRPE